MINPNYQVTTGKTFSSQSKIRATQHTGITVVWTKFAAMAIVLILSTFATEPCMGQKAEFEASVEEWRSAIKESTYAGGMFFRGDEASSKEWRTKWESAVKKAHSHRTDVKRWALAYFNSTQTPDEELRKLIMLICRELISEGGYHEAYETMTRYVGLFPEDTNAHILKGRASILINEFAEAEQFFDDYPKVIPKLPKLEKDLFENIVELRKLHEEELATQAKEAEANDLPRVKITTSKGTIIVELFENEAPTTVGNFISLVESGFYSEKIFHRVVNEFVAQAGLFDPKGQKHHINYVIFDEFGVPGARNHFRGTLAMAKKQDPNSGGSQFFFNFVPNPSLNGRYTVFGRVISGWKALDSLTRTMELNKHEAETPIKEAVPDKILKMEVLRKRDHEYKPNKNLMLQR